MADAGLNQDHCGGASTCFTDPDLTCPSDSELTACSASKVESVTDFSKDYCNTRNLVCGDDVGCVSRHGFAQDSALVKFLLEDLLADLHAGEEHSTLERDGHGFDDRAMALRVTADEHLYKYLRSLFFALFLN